MPSSYTSACMHLLNHWLALRRTSRPQIQSVQQVTPKQPIANTITQRGVQQVSFPGDNMRVEV